MEVKSRSKPTIEKEKWVSKRSVIDLPRTYGLFGVNDTVAFFWFIKPGFVLSILVYTFVESRMKRCADTMFRQSFKWNRLYNAEEAVLRWSSRKPAKHWFVRAPSKSHFTVLFAKRGTLVDFIQSNPCRVYIVACTVIRASEFEWKRIDRCMVACQNAWECRWCASDNAEWITISGRIVLISYDLWKWV